MAGSVYQVGVHLHAQDGVSGVLANISKSVLGLHGHLGTLQKGFSSFNVGVVGAAAVAAGLKLAHVNEHLVEHGLQLRHWQVQMEAAGASSVQVANMTAAAWKLAGVNMNTTATDNMKNIIELNKVTGNWEESAKLLPTFAKVETVLAGVKANGLHSGITGNSTQTLNFARGLEELGVTTARKKSDGTTESEEEVAARIEKYSQGFIKTMQVSRGLFDGNQLYAATNTSAGASQNWDFDMATKVAPMIGEIMKAGKFGNADYMSLKSFQSGKITGDAADALLKYHLVGADDLRKDAKGKTLGLKANTEFSQGMESNLWTWSQKVLDTLAKNGVNIEDQKKINDILNEIGSNKSNTGLLRTILEPHERAQIQKELNQLNKVPDNVADVVNSKDPFIKLQNLEKKWDDFLTALGGPLVDPAIATLDKMTVALKDLSQFFIAHPEVAKAIALTSAALSGLLVVGGSLAVAGAVAAALGPAGWIVLGITAIGAAAGIALTTFPKLGTSIMSVVDKILGIDRQIFDFLTGSSKEQAAAIKAAWDWVATTGATAAWDAIKAVGNAMLDALKAIPGMIFGGGTGGPSGTPGLRGYSSGEAPHGRGQSGSGSGLMHPSSYGGPEGGGGASAYDAIMRAEGTAGNDPYNVVLGNGAYGRPDSALTGMTLAQAYAAGNAIRKNPRNRTNSSAIGAFQITGTTMHDAAKALGYDWNSTKFDPEHQRAMAAWIAQNQGLGAWEGLKNHPDEMRRARGGSWNVPEKHQPPSKPLQIQANLHMDGKKVAQHTFTAMLGAANTPAHGSQMPDDSRGTYGPGSSYNLQTG